MSRTAIMILTAFWSGHAAWVAGETTPSSAPIRDPQRTFQRDVQSFQRMRQRHIVMQQTDYSCGAAALATIVRYYWGDPVDERYFLKSITNLLTPEELQDRVKNGLSMTDLRKAAEKRGYLAVMGRRKIAELAEARVPVIVRVVIRKHEHFVVLRGVGDNVAYLADPIRGHVRVPLDEFARQWEDGAVLIVAKAGVEDLPENTPLSLQPNEKSPVRPELQAVRRQLAQPSP